MSSPQEVLAICVNWNGQEVLADALDSLLKSRGVQLRVVVVDNASTDNSLELVPPGIEVEKREKNEGYAAAINSVVRPYYANPKTPGTTPPTYFLLLNNDVVFEPTSVQRLVEFADRKGPGIFGPRIVRHDRPDHLETAWGDLTWSHVLAHYRGEEEKVGPRWNRDAPVSLLLGSVLLIHRSVFEKIGFFDETFFMYHEEVDFLYRARLAGIDAYFCNNSQVRHRGGHGTRQTPWKRIYWTRRNAVLFLRKHKASLAKWLYYLATLKMSIFYNILCLRWKRTGVILRGVRDGFAQVRGQGNSLGSRSRRAEDSD
jgi:GT2 family glycosyltransferase